MEQQFRTVYYSSLVRYGSKSKRCSILLALKLLMHSSISWKSKTADKRQVIFIDELPWLDTPPLGICYCIRAFLEWMGSRKAEYHAYRLRPATSWISDKLLNNEGGLFDRTTDEISLCPFTLGECEEYYQANNIVMSKFDEIQCYMADRWHSLSDFQCCRKAKSLVSEYGQAFLRTCSQTRFDSLTVSFLFFTNAEDCMTIVRLLAQKRQGYTRKEIVSLTKIP